MNKLNIITWTIVLMSICSCVKRPDEPAKPAPGALPDLAELKDAVAGADELYPNLVSPVEFTNNRAKGSNGWPEIVTVGKEYDELSEGHETVYLNGIDIGSWQDWEYWHTYETWSEVPEIDLLMDAAMLATDVLAARLAKAANSDFIVPIWDDGIDLMPETNAFLMLTLRTQIYIQHEDYSEARQVLETLMKLVGRKDGDWNFFSSMLGPGNLYGLVMDLTDKDDSSEAITLIDTLFSIMQQDRQWPFEMAYFELLYTVSLGRDCLNNSESDWQSEYYSGTLKEQQDYVDDIVDAIAFRLDVANAVKDKQWDLLTSGGATKFLSDMKALERSGYASILTERAGQFCSFHLKDAAIKACLKLRKFELQDVPDPIAKLGSLAPIRAKMADGKVTFEFIEDYPDLGKNHNDINVEYDFLK